VIVAIEQKKCLTESITETLELLRTTRRQLQDCYDLISEKERLHTQFENQLEVIQAKLDVDCDHHYKPVKKPDRTEITDHGFSSSFTHLAWFRICICCGKEVSISLDEFKWLSKGQSDGRSGAGH